MVRFRFGGLFKRSGQKERNREKIERPSGKLKRKRRKGREIEMFGADNRNRNNIFEAFSNCTREGFQVYPPLKKAQY